VYLITEADKVLFPIIWFRVIQINTF